MSGVSLGSARKRDGPAGPAKGGRLARWALAGAAAGMALLFAVIGLTACGSSPARSASGPAAAVRLAAYAISPVSQITGSCPFGGDEIEQAVDGRYVYEEWIGCGGIGFAASADGGLHFGKPVVLKGSRFGWDPSVAVAPDGTVYAAFMARSSRQMFPVVEASVNHGRTFPRMSMLLPRQAGNWGDRDFIAVGPRGTLYLTWDYGPSASAVKLVCPPGGSCSFSQGDLNVVLQKSVDGGRTWSQMVHVSPGFPASGADAGPLLVQPGGRIYVEYQRYHVTGNLKLGTSLSYVTSSADGGRTWSRPVLIGTSRLTMSDRQWWIDGDIGADAAGNLYVSYDTQVAGRDIGWLSYSTNHGRTWSALHRVTPDNDDAAHIVQVAGGSRGLVYVGWLADNARAGWALYLRPFSITKGWLSAPIRVSRQFGNKAIWPGDTIGLSAEPPATSGPHAGWPRVAVTWGSAPGRSRISISQDYAAVVSFDVRP